jgi:hypothetical protein
VSYRIFGIEGVRLLAFSVSADTEPLSPMQLAVASMIGPVISYATIVVAGIFSWKRYSPFWVMLGLSAPIGRIVNAVYIYFRLLGYHPNPNFDEYNFSRSIDIDPLIVSVPTMLIVIAVFYYFGRAAWKFGGLGEIVQLIAGICVGLTIWTQIGPILLR